MQLKKKKWIGIAIAAVLAVVLSTAIDSTPIAHRAIVSGIAIDIVDPTESQSKEPSADKDDGQSTEKSGGQGAEKGASPSADKNGGQSAEKSTEKASDKSTNDSDEPEIKAGTEIEITAQILVASGSGSAANAKQVSAKSKTISGAFNNISKWTSMSISLAHCNLVIIGKNVLDGNAYRVLDYLIRNAYLSENAMLLGSLTTGKEILNTKVAFSEIASFYAQRSIFTYGTYQGIAKRSIKNFVVDFNKPCQTNYLPIIEKSKVPLGDEKSGEKGAEPTLSEESSSGAGSSGASGSGSAKGGEEFLFDLTKTAVLKGETMLMVLDESGTAGLNYVLNEVKRGAMTVPSDNGELIELYIINKSMKKKYDLDTHMVSYDLGLGVIFKEEMKTKADKNYKRTVKMTEAEEITAAEIVRKKIIKVYEETRALKLDVYGICEAFHGKYNLKIDDDAAFLDSIGMEINVWFNYN